MLPNVTFIKETKNVYFNPKKANSGTPKIYVKYAPIEGAVPDYTEDGLFCLGDTSRIKGMTINGEKLNFTPPTKIQQPLEVLASDIDIENEIYSGNNLLIPFVDEGFYTLTIKPKNTSVTLNGNYYLGSITSNGEVTTISVYSEPLNSNSDIIYDSSQIIQQTDIYYGTLIGVTTLLSGFLNSKGKNSPFIADENKTPIDTLVSINKDLYTGGLSNHFTFDNPGTYNVTLDMVDSIANTCLFVEVFLGKNQTTDESETYVYVPIITDIKYENIESIEFYNCAGGSYLSSVTFTEGLKKIITNFTECSITTLELPSTIETLVTSFVNCTSLTSITCYAKTAPNILNSKGELDSFTNGSPTGTLYYPKGSDYSTWLTAFGDGWTGVEI